MPRFNLNRIWLAPLLVLLALGAAGVASAAASGTHVAARATPVRQHHHPVWKQVFSGNFNHGFSRRIWTRYSGVPRCCSSTRWSPSHIVARRGVLHLQNYRQGGRWVSAGVSMGRSLNQTYGKWSVRFRMARGMGVGMCIALWPKQGWPPEIDFAEETSDLGNRGIQTGTFHYGKHNSQNHARVRANFSRWHVMSVVWKPGTLVYLLDGRPWHRVSGAIVPNQPMHLFMQTHVGSNGYSGGMPSAALRRHVDLQIDWVHVYRLKR